MASALSPRSCSLASRNDTGGGIHLVFAWLPRRGVGCGARPASYGLLMLLLLLLLLLQAYVQHTQLICTYVPSPLVSPGSRRHSVFCVSYAYRPRLWRLTLLYGAH